MQLFRKQPKEQTSLILTTLQTEGVERVEANLSPLPISIETLSKKTNLLIQNSKSQELKVVYSMASLISTIFILVGVTALLQNRHFPEPEWFSSYFPPVMFFLGCLPGFKLALNVARRQKRGSTLVREILSHEYADTIPLLLDIVTSDCTNKQAMFDIHTKLIYLLSLVNEREATHFKAYHVHHLNALLMRTVTSLHGEPRPEMPLKTAIVRALAYVGDEQSLKHLYRLHRQRPNLNPQANEFYNAVEEALPLLELRIERQKETQTLLRASSEPVNNQTLLRPSYSSPHDPEQELLRPIDTE